MEHECSLPHSQVPCPPPVPTLSHFDPVSAFTSLLLKIHLIFRCNIGLFQLFAAFVFFIFICTALKYSCDLPVAVQKLFAIISGVAKSLTFGGGGRGRIVMTAPDRNYKLSKTQLHIEFPFICLGNSNFFRGRKSSSFTFYSVARGGLTSPSIPVAPLILTSYKSLLYNNMLLEDRPGRYVHNLQQNGISYISF